jgi:hypothetical protein
MISKPVIGRATKPRLLRKETGVKKGMSAELGKCCKGVGKSVAVPWQST